MAGEILGLRSSNALQRKQDYETTFSQRVAANTAWKQAYSNLLEQLAEIIQEH